MQTLEAINSKKTATSFINTYITNYLRLVIPESLFYKVFKPVKMIRVYF